MVKDILNTNNWAYSTWDNKEQSGQSPSLIQFKPKIIKKNILMLNSTVHEISTPYTTKMLKKWRFFYDSKM